MSPNWFWASFWLRIVNHLDNKRRPINIPWNAQFCGVKYSLALINGFDDAVPCLRWHIFMYAHVEVGTWFVRWESLDSIPVNL